ncbi:MAG: hypothetical protein ACI3ZK_08120 [Candidatus Cryptobacteroides sp.]
MRRTLMKICPAGQAARGWKACSARGLRERSLDQKEVKQWPDVWAPHKMFHQMCG